MKRSGPIPRRTPIRRKTPLRATGATTKKRRGKTPLKIADGLFSQIVRARGRCEAAGVDGHPCRGYLQCAHIIRRNYYPVRWDERNALSLCMAHHAYYTDRPDEWRDFIGHRRYDALWHRAQGKTRTDYPALIARLEARLRAVTDGG